MRAAWQAGLLDAETLARINSVKCVEGEKLPAGKDRSAEEIGAMMDACPGTIIGLRDAAVISLLYATGIRRSELINLDVSDYDPESGALNVRHAKGNRQRLAYVEIPEAKEALEAWLEKRRASVLADERLEKATGNRKGLYDDGPLFLGTNGHESVNARRLTPQSIYNLMHVRGTLAGIPDVTVHDLRRSFCTALLDAGVDVLIVMRLMGHARPETTAIYDRRPERAKQQAAALLHIPRGGDHKTKKTK
jgi:site-specific recombinase XerD